MNMDFGLKNRTALVTGASAGLGRAIALALAGEGVSVIGVARREDKLRDLGTEIAEGGGPALRILTCDLSNPDAARDLAARAEALAPGGIDILANVAGSSRPTTMDPDMTIWREAYQLGFLSHVQLTFSLLPGMRRRGWGRVVTITGSSEPQFLSAATAPKAGLHAWSKAVSKLVAPDGVTVNCIQPGKVLSEQIERKFPDAADRDAYARESIPMGRIGEARELAEVAAFLCSERASYVTGIVFPVDGGLRNFSH